MNTRHEQHLWILKGPSMSGMPSLVVYFARGNVVEDTFLFCGYFYLCIFILVLKSGELGAGLVIYK